MGGGYGDAWQQHLLLKGSRSLYVSWANLEKNASAAWQDCVHACAAPALKF